MAGRLARPPEEVIIILGFLSLHLKSGQVPWQRAFNTTRLADNGTCRRFDLNTLTRPDIAEGDQRITVPFTPLGTP